MRFSCKKCNAQYNIADERVRGNPNGKYPNAKYNHWEREGQIFSVDEPPEDGHPGEPIRCRCYRRLQEAEVLGDTEHILQPGEVLPAAEGGQDKS